MPDLSFVRITLVFKKKLKVSHVKNPTQLVENCIKFLVTSMKPIDLTGAKVLHDDLLNNCVILSTHF